jgi:hypothetical protein
VIATQVISSECEQLADAFSQEILVKADLVSTSEGEITLSSHRMDGKFGRIVLNTSTSSARRELRVDRANIRQLAAGVRAKIQARASGIDSAARKVTVAIHPRRQGYDIEVIISYR